MLWAENIQDAFSYLKFKTYLDNDAQSQDKLKSNEPRKIRGGNAGDGSEFMIKKKKCRKENNSTHRYQSDQDKFDDLLNDHKRGPMISR